MKAEIKEKLDQSDARLKTTDPTKHAEAKTSLHLERLSEDRATSVQALQQLYALTPRLVRCICRERLAKEQLAIQQKDTEFTRR